MEQNFGAGLLTLLIGISSVELVHIRLCRQHVLMRSRLDLGWTPVRLVDDLIGVRDGFGALANEYN